jgi:hypothetical protein
MTETTVNNNSTPQKIKRKFSLKNLRGKFKSSSSSSAPPPVPVLPSLPAKDLVQAVLTKKPLPEPVEFQPEPSSPVSQEPPVEEMEDATENVVSQEEATTEATSSNEGMRSLSLDETSDDSTTSSAISTPVSTPPDTPDSDKVGPVFGMFQQEGFVAAKTIGLGLADREVVTIAGTEGLQRGSVDTVRPTARGLIRSQGMNKLDSLHFDQLDFNLATF